MSDNSSIISGVESDKEEKKLNEKYLSINKKENITAYAHETQNWGKKKDRYYKKDADSGDSEAEREEEIEANALKAKAAQKLSNIDYWDEGLDNEQSENEIKYDKKIESEYNQNALLSLSQELGLDPQIIEKMSMKELNQTIFKGWPEIKGVIKEIDQISDQIKQITKLILKEQNQEIKRFNEIKKGLLQNYLAILMFHLQLRAKTRMSQNHPIYQQINEYKELIEQVQEYEKFAQLLSMHKQKNEKISKQKKQIEEEQDTLALKKTIKDVFKKKDNKVENKINKIKQLLENVDQKYNSTPKHLEKDDSPISLNQDDMLDALNDDDINDNGIDDIYQQNIERIKETKKQKKDKKRQEKLDNFNKLDKIQKLNEVNEDDPRKITYVMLKNISLMRRRRGNRIRNSRVKHKLRYEKALYKLKSQNKYIKTPQLGNYSGEAGIKQGLVKGVRLQ